VVFIALAVIASKLKGRLLEGDILLGYVIGYPLGRFFVEYFRPDAWMLGPLAAAQVFAIICVTAGVVLLVVRHVRARRVRPQPVAEAVKVAPEPEAETPAAAPEAEA